MYQYPCISVRKYDGLLKFISGKANISVDSQKQTKQAKTHFFYDDKKGHKFRYVLVYNLLLACYKNIDGK